MRTKVAKMDHLSISARRCVRIIGSSAEENSLHIASRVWYIVRQKEIYKLHSQSHMELLARINSRANPSWRSSRENLQNFRTNCKTTMGKTRRVNCERENWNCTLAWNIFGIRSFRSNLRNSKLRQRVIALDRIMISELQMRNSEINSL